MAALLFARSVRAQEAQITYEAPPAEEPGLGATLGFGAAGAFTAFLLHESGHVLANLMLGNVPRFRGTLVWGAVPFFVISPAIHCRDDRCTKHNGDDLLGGRNGAYFIATAGFNVQNITNEILLTSDPGLAGTYAPFRKGLLGFNVFLSVMYAVAAYTKLESPHGDLVSAGRRLQIDEAWLATLLLVPTVLDVYRYFYPSSTWSIRASRVGTATQLGLAFVF